MSNQNQNGAPPAQQPKKTLNPMEAQALLAEMLVELNECGEDIVMKRVEEKGLDPAGVGWLLSQACLSVAVASYFHARQPLPVLLDQIKQAWHQHEQIAAQTAHQIGKA